MIEVDDVGIKTRARLGEALTRLIESDPRVRRRRRLVFTDDGGVVVAIELHTGTDTIAGEVIARELEFLASSALPKRFWVRVQVV
jgi:urease accessory protein UreE